MFRGGNHRSVRVKNCWKISLWNIRTIICAWSLLSRSCLGEDVSDWLIVQKTTWRGVVESSLNSWKYELKGSSHGEKGTGMYAGWGDSGHGIPRLPGGNWENSWLGRAMADGRCGRVAVCAYREGGNAHCLGVWASRTDNDPSRGKKRWGEKKLSFSPARGEKKRKCKKVGEK